MPFVIKPKMGKLAGLFGGIVAGSYSGKELAGSFAPQTGIGRRPDPLP